jgi:hypothetical protein
MYHILNEYLYAERKKVRKINNLLHFSKSKGHNFGKNEWIETKLKLDLYLGMAKQCTKYQMNIYKQREKKKVRKTVKSLKIAKFKGRNSSKNRSIATIFELDM